MIAIEAGALFDGRDAVRVRVVVTVDEGRISGVGALGTMLPAGRIAEGLDADRHQERSGAARAAWRAGCRAEPAAR
jgi:hypothetical protein